MLPPAKEVMANSIDLSPWMDGVIDVIGIILTSDDPS